MSTTTLRLPEALRALIAKLAQRSGKTAHSLMLEAIAQKVEEEELRASFYGEADTRFAEIIKSGAGIPWHDMRAYLKTRAKGKRRARPDPARGQVVLSEHLQSDFERIFDFLFEHAPETAADRIAAIIAALDVSESSPLIGRSLEDELRSSRLRECPAHGPCVASRWTVQGQSISRPQSGENSSQSRDSASSAGSRCIRVLQGQKPAQLPCALITSGALSAHEPSAFFHIISKDSGFDPLIKHLKGKGVLAHRSVTIAAIPFFKPDVPVTTDAQVDAAVAYLVRLKAAKPKRRKRCWGPCTPS